MDFLDEYKPVMEKYAGLKVFVNAYRNVYEYHIDYGNCSYMRFWYDHGVYCFDIEERGEVRRGGMFNSPSIDLTQKVMLNYTVSILRHALGFESLGLPMEEDELPNGWRLQEAPIWRYVALDGPNGEHLDFETSDERLCVPLAWLYDVSPSELLHAYMLPDGGPLLRRWLGRPYWR